jgi:hypothetical protein
MRKVIGRLDDDVTIESVLIAIDGHPHHRYRITGGQQDGREFETLAAVGGYVIEGGHEVRAPERPETAG